ncbi:plasminogen-like [Ptychodera flava]|uniref:plasminogen-like n=1 Tax=Ptychodera flava TaxID=63121 RepID=UPI00396A2F82
MVCDGIRDCPDDSDEHYYQCDLMAFDATYSKRLSPRDAVLITEAFSSQECAQSCLRFSEFVCLSFDYDFITRECYINPGNKDTVVFTLTEDFSYLYYERIYHDLSALDKNTALKFERFPNALIKSDDPPQKTTTEECAQLCLDETIFACLAFTYEPMSSQCWLHNASHSLDGIPLIKDSNYDYYDRRGIDCYALEDGTDYRGRLFVTSKGDLCENWSSLDPSKFKVTPSTVPGKGLGDHNYCRNPNGETTPWCYTSSKSEKKERCAVGLPKLECLSQKPREQERIGSIPRQDSETFTPITVECFGDPYGLSYRGSKSITVSGRRCQNWFATSPHFQTWFFNISVEDKNYCRNPVGSRKFLPWCYTTDPNVRWEYCDVREPPCVDPGKGTYAPMATLLLIKPT